MAQLEWRWHPPRLRLLAGIRIFAHGDDDDDPMQCTHSCVCVAVLQLLLLLTLLPWACYPLPLHWVKESCHELSLCVLATLAAVNVRHRTCSNCCGTLAPMLLALLVTSCFCFVNTNFLPPNSHDG